MADLENRNKTWLPHIKISRQKEMQTAAKTFILRALYEYFPEEFPIWL